MDAASPFRSASVSDSVLRASGGTRVAWDGACIESPWFLPGSMGGVTEGGVAGSWEVGTERWGGVSLDGPEFEAGVGSGGRQGSGGCEVVGGEDGCD